MRIIAHVKDQEKGGAGRRVIVLGEARDGAGPNGDRPPRRAPAHVEEVLRAAADRLDPARPAIACPRRQVVAGEWLGVQPGLLRMASQHLTTLAGHLFAVAAEQTAREAGAPPLTGPDGHGAPDVEPLHLTAGTVAVPVRFMARFPRGVVAPSPVVVSLRRSIDGGFEVSAYGQVDQPTLVGVLDRLRVEGKTRRNPYRGSVLTATHRFDHVHLEATARPDAAREGLVLDRAVWDEIDLNVGRFLDRLDTFDALGLGSNRGVLLAGRPGVGKSQVCRVLTAELAGRCTILHATPEAMQVVSEVYEYAGYLAPSVVIIEDIDLSVGERGPWLHKFLEAIDGVASSHDGVVTIATTNHPEQLDPAARRAARFDRIVRFELPSCRAREVILERYLAPIDCDVDVRRVAEHTEGATGADLREIVRHAVLLAPGRLDTESMLEAARARELYSGPEHAYL